jgi:hypothetical protein
MHLPTYPVLAPGIYGRVQTCLSPRDLWTRPNMPIFEIFRQTISALWDTKLRSFLTMFGIIWGITD